MYRAAHQVRGGNAIFRNGSPSSQLDDWNWEIV
jgi:hypothetical protein